MSETQSTEQPLELVIAGGGMAGSLLAYVLLSQNPVLKLAIIEQSSESEPSKASFDSRSIALAHGSVELLQQWGLWQDLQQSGCAIKHIHISDRGHFGKTYLNAADHQLTALGQVIEVEAIGEVLWQKLKAFTAEGRLSWFYSDAIQALNPTLNPTAELQQVQLKSGAVLQTKLLVIAEGGLSPSRSLAGFELKSDDYQQHALIANIGLADSHQHKAFERFTPTGPLALLPLTRQRYSLVWTLTPEQAAHHVKQPEPEFLAALQQAAGHRAGVFKTLGQRVVYPLSLKRATEASRHRTVLLGNSLHNLHPIAGQGFNLAIRDIYSLSLLLQKHQADAGCYQLTKAYQQARLPDMQQVILYTDSLVRLFSNSSRLMALGRNTGLLALNLCPELKQAVANQAMGLNSIRQLKALLS